MTRGTQEGGGGREERKGKMGTKFCKCGRGRRIEGREETWGREIYYIQV